MSKQSVSSPDDILASAQSLRWEVRGDFHEHLMESIYTDAALHCRPSCYTPR